MIKNGVIYPGQPLTMTETFQDDDCTLIDPTTVTFKTMSPSGVEATYVYLTNTEVQKSSTGIYTATFTPNEGGRWYTRWITTGTGMTVVDEDNIIVKQSPFVDRRALDYD